ncbi:indole-3-glycerol phosphate synthase TrpC [soil metagenome]
MSYLAKLLESTRTRLAEAKQRVTLEALEQRLAGIDEPRSLRAALDGPGVAVIAEIKRASPSAGIFDANLNATETATAYARGGAAAISVLTEPEFFKGSLDDLASARAAGLPVLRKDFILDTWQVLESRAAGADALLLIVRALEQPELETLLGACRTLRVEALVEVYDEEEMTRALRAGATIVGVNNRDLESFEVDRERTIRLAPQVPKGVTLVGLSGVGTRSDVEELGAAGAQAVLVGESLVRADDPAAELRALRGEP